MPGVPWHTQILADQLTLFQSWGTDYAHLITTGTPGFTDLPTALVKVISSKCVFNPSYGLPGVFKIKILYVFRPNFGPYLSQTVDLEGQKPL